MLAPAVLAETMVRPLVDTNRTVNWPFPGRVRIIFPPEISVLKEIGMEFFTMLSEELLTDTTLGFVKIISITL